MKISLPKPNFIEPWHNPFCERGVLRPLMTRHLGCLMAILCVFSVSVCAPQAFAIPAKTARTSGWCISQTDNTALGHMVDAGCYASAKTACKRGNFSLEGGTIYPAATIEKKWDIAICSSVGAADKAGQVYAVIAHFKCADGYSATAPGTCLPEARGKALKGTHGA